MVNRLSEQELKEQKRLQKQRDEEVARIYSNLIPVAKSCPAALDIHFIDPTKNIFKKSGDKWLRVYRLKGLERLFTERRKAMLDELFLAVNIRVRFTTTYDTGDKTAIRQDFMTFIAVGDEYPEIIDELEQSETKALEVLWAYGMEIFSMTINEVMQVIQQNFGFEADFDYKSVLLRKENWGNKCFAKLLDRGDYIIVSDQFGSCYFCAQFPSNYIGDILSRFKEMGCPLCFALDLYPLSAEVISDFNRTMETKYNRKLELSAKRDIINCSFMMGFLTDSEDARKIVEQTLYSIFSSYGFVFAPCINNEVTTMQSLLSMGVVDTHAMRNVSMNVIPSLLL